MYSQDEDLQLQAENLVPTVTTFDDLAHIKFPARKELMEAARVLASGALYSTLFTQYSTCVSNAITRSRQNIR